jgi:hypothetical protein
MKRVLGKVCGRSRSQAVYVSRPKEVAALIDSEIRLRFNENGVVIPASFRKALGIKPLVHIARNRIPYRAAEIAMEDRRICSSGERNASMDVWRA